MKKHPEPETEIKFKWNASLQVGVDAMDDKHKVLIEHMNRVYELNHAGASKTVLQSSLTELLDYAKRHFNDEETYMASINYPDLKVHQQAHLTLINRLEDDFRTFTNGPGRL